MINLTVGGSTHGEKNVSSDMELSRLHVSGSEVMSPLDVAAQACLDLGRARNELHAFTSSRLPSSLKHCLLWGAVGLTATAGALSTSVGCIATMAFVGGTAIDGVNHLADNDQARNHPDFPHWILPVGSVVTVAVTALLARGAWNTGHWLLDLIGRENAEQLNALRHHVDAAEMGLANAVAELSASEWEAFLGGLEDGQLASIVPSSRVLTEDRQVQVMAKLVQSGLAHHVMMSAPDEEKARLRLAYGACGDRLMAGLEGNGFGIDEEAFERALPGLLACIALSPVGFASSFPDAFQKELERPERRDQVLSAVQMLPGLAQSLGIEPIHVDRFAEGVGGIGARLMEISKRVPMADVVL